MGSGRHRPDPDPRGERGGATAGCGPWTARGESRSACGRRPAPTLTGEFGRIQSGVQEGLRIGGRRDRSSRRPNRSHEADPNRGRARGGSSDAAATLLGLSRLLGEVGLPTPDLSSLAPKLGADVPFFLEGGIRLGTGVGEILRPLPPCPWRDLVLVFPNVGVSTGSVFQRWETGLTLPGPLARMAGLEIPRTFWEQDVDGFRNDLEPIVSVAYPVVDEILSEFRRLGSAFARMSGSGSTVFGVATDRVQAREWAGSFRRRGFWARAVRPGNRGCRVR